MVRSRSHRRGSVLPTLGVCLVSLFGFVALAVDLGMLAVSRTQLQNSADAAALVGARNLNNQVGSTDTNRTAALAAARSAAKANSNLSGYVGDADISAITAGQYTYSSATQAFSVSYPGSISATDSWSAVNVQLATTPATYFMRVLGITSMPTGASATAVHRPRDIAFALDFTGSMGWSSPVSWPYMNGPSGNQPTEGLMNPDTAYPKFGHYARYTYYQNTT
ncbi:MAG TPA: pilus assembly protein TadG-related protein, partial [Urbifossiella sp.]